MTRGAILFAFNNQKFDYYKMAVATAKRINHFLNMPVTVVTNDDSITDTTYKFDHTITVEADKTNYREKQIWINKGRYQAYELSPYDETLLLDTDYMINSTKLLSVFDYYDDFCCHDTTSYLMEPNAAQEVLSSYSFKTLWATAVCFKKTIRTRQIFECLEMVQKNYEHYGNIHNFIGGVFRNDYALTLALRITNGHTSLKRDVIPWNLVHVGNKNIHIYRNNDDEFNTEYTVIYDNWSRNKIRKEYITLKDMDFHVMNKENFMELIA
jgi:hypothetical protein